MTVSGASRLTAQRSPKKKKKILIPQIRKDMQIGLLTRWAWQRLLPLVFLPSFSRRGLARISLVCVQEGGWCQLSNATHRLIITFPIFPFIKPVNHFGSSGCRGGGEKVIRTSWLEPTLRATLFNPWNSCLNVLCKIPTNFWEQGPHLSPDHSLPCCYSWTESWLCIY